MMPNFVYPVSCGDYYPTCPDSEGVCQQLEDLVNIPAMAFLSVGEQGIKRIGLGRKIWEVVRVVFGFVNRTGTVRVNSEIVKLLYYAEVRGDMDKDWIFRCVTNLKEEIDRGRKRTDARVKTIVEEIFQAHQKNTICDLKKLRQNIVAFHKSNESKLQPSFWYGLFHDRKIASCSWENFGSSHLQLARLASRQEHSGGLIEVLRQYQMADLQHNENSHFQDEFRKQFKEFVEKEWEIQRFSSPWPQIDQTIHSAIEHLTVSLSEIAKSNQQYPQVTEFIESFGLRYFPKTQKLKALLCESFVKQAKYTNASKNKEALEAELLLLEGKIQRLLPEEDKNRKVLEAQMLLTSEVLGDFYSNHRPRKAVVLISEPDYQMASQHYLRAWKHDPTNAALEVKVFQSLMNAAQKERETILSTLKEWFGFKNEQENEIVEQATDFIAHVDVQELKTLIRHLERLKQFDKAIHFYEFASQKYPVEFESHTFELSAKTYFQSGMTFQEQNHLIQAYEKFVKACELDPTNRDYKKQLFGVAKQLAKTKVSEKALLPAYGYFQKALECANSEREVNEISVQIRDIAVHFADLYLGRCYVPYLNYRNTEAFTENWNKHKIQHHENLRAAISWLDRAILLDPKSAELHFDKAELIQYFELEDLNYMSEYNLATEYNRKNPFYWMRLAEEHLLQSDNTMGNEYKEKALKAASEGFGFQYLHWFDERYVKKGIYNINPHTA